MMTLGTLTMSFILKYSFALKVSSPGELLKAAWTDVKETDGFMIGMQRPINQEDLSYNEKSGLRPDLENHISKLSHNSSSKKPTLYFIGDSFIRNQAAAACSVVTKDHKLNPKFRYGGPNMNQECSGELGTIVFHWVTDFYDGLVSGLQEGHSAPDVIYLGINLWSIRKDIENKVSEEVALQKYKKRANEILRAWARDAPNAQIKLFLAHKLCNEKWHKDKSWKDLKHNDGIENGMVQARNDILKVQAANAPIHIGVVDGWTLTEKLGCAATDDGRHYDKYVFQELMEMFQA
eukprot:gnl/MRDRNA2_/MRDRNA2_36135_c0_seq1.p1 gnl/MRDRNA2_/MRDRNA2_36135_c0~~gnl/MRDRNA2_/MRDRNA2_36135_c0_seq1.p1  ORF type:complete len:292 (+),score=55.67 gnl/MRDRNA2_/MRDRNA2_36135_c0_seq1:75-950(+)